MEKLKADMVVIGGGGSGLVAAVSAAEAGIKNIVVLEKNKRAGGYAIRAGGMMAFDSPAQRRLGIKIDKDEIFKDKMTRLNWQVNARLIRNIIDTDCVIIAAGEFGPNPEMMKKYFPMLRNPESHMNPSNQGDGIKMADEAGAWIEDVVAKHMFPMTLSHRLGTLMLRPELIWLNKKGERFLDESLVIHHLESAVNQLMLQPSHSGFMVFDTSIIKQMLSKRNVLSGQERDSGKDGKWFDTLEDILKREGDEGDGMAGPEPMPEELPPAMDDEEGPPPWLFNKSRKATKRADTWEGISDFIGVDPEKLKTTIEKYNGYCESGYDAEFLKDAGHLLPLHEPPFYATVVDPSFHSTMGGIRVSHRMEVLSKQSTLMPGLYAVGDNANSFVYADYDFKYPGTSLGYALISGYIAGKSAQQYLETRL